MTSSDAVLVIAVAILAAATVGAVVASVVLRRQQALAGELRAARERRAALDAISDVWQWQTDSAHRLVSLSPPAQASSGSGPLAIAAGVFWEQWTSTDKALLEARMRSGATLADIEVEPGTGDAGACLFRLRGRPLHDAAGAFCGYVGTLREIAAPRPAEGPHAGMPAAVASPPIDADDESLGTIVSHDLRAPIRVVEGFTRIVKEDYAATLDRVGIDHLDRVLGAAARMNHMIDALLGLSRLASQPIVRVPVNLSQLAAYVVEDLRRLRPDHAVDVEIEPGMVTLGDPTLLRMVLENLLGNAWKYTSHTEAPSVAFVRHAETPATYTVRDNGAGFDPRYADRLFGVFQRLHSASEFPGTGVGLASVRRIVRRHGGEIHAEGEPERGASFHFSLPPGEAEL